MPSSAASMAALSLLMSLALTNTPALLFRALPSYKTDAEGPRRSSNPGVNSKMAAEVKEEDSEIGKLAVVIGHTKDCWSVLWDGFIQRIDADEDAPKSSRDDDSDQGDRSPHSSSTIANHAWGMLEWYILCFERDQELTVARGEGNAYLCISYCFAEAHVP
jgi:hypothetical protein